MRSRSCSPLGGGLVLPGRGLVSGGSLGGSSSGGLCENQQPGGTHTRTLHRRWARRAPAHAHAHAHAPCPRTRGRAVATAARRPTWRARATPQHERHSPRPRAPLRPHPRAAAPPRDSLLPGIVASTRSRVEGRGVLFRGPLRAGGGGSATPSPMALALPESASASAPRTRPLDCLGPRAGPTPRALCAPLLCPRRPPPPGPCRPATHPARATHATLAPPAALPPSHPFDRPPHRPLDRPSCVCVAVTGLLA